MSNTRKESRQLHQAAWKLAELQGQPEGLFLMVPCYYEGIGVDRDIPHGIQNLEAAAKLGMPLAQMTVGRFLEKGYRDRLPDLPKAFAVIKQAADANYVPAMVDLASMYRFGQGTAKNPTLAMQWLQRAADGDSLRRDAQSRPMFEHRRRRAQGSNPGDALDASSRRYNCARRGRSLCGGAHRRKMGERGVQMGL